MICLKNNAVFAFLAYLSSTAFAETNSTDGLIYRQDPQSEWEARVPSVRRGNGVFLSPNNDLIISSSSDGYIACFDALTGVKNWDLPPPVPTGMFPSSSSGVTFASDGTVDFVVHAVKVNEITDDAKSFVIATSLEGAELWISPMLDCVVPGTPVVSEDGRFVFFTCNSDALSVGHFFILDGQNNGDIFHTQKNDNAPFGPLGIYHNPEEGYYDGGEGNRNDIVVWSVQPKPSDFVVGPGTIFGFQFPLGFTGQLDGVGYTVLDFELNKSRDFQAISKPVLTNGGRSLYWGVSRSQFRAWVGELGRDRYRFSRSFTAGIGFSRGSPPRQAVFATPALSSDPVEPFLFGGTAAEEFVRLNFDFSEELLVSTTSLVYAEARVSPDDSVVYYVEFSGQLHQASTNDLMDVWQHDIGVPVEGEFSLNEDGTMLYIADVTGFIRAFRVADTPTDSPTPSPTAVPSAAPTMAPSSAPSSTPSLRPVAVSLAPTPAPIPQPTFKPIAAEPFEPSIPASASSWSCLLGNSMLTMALSALLFCAM